jgi:hypothetical protein
MARQQIEKLAAVTTGSAESSGIPCAMVLTLITRSPWEPGLFAPIAREIITSQAWPQRREARTTRLRVRIEIVRLRMSAATQHVHRIPRSTFVTIAKRPS